MTLPPLTFSHFEEIQKRGYSLDIVFLLMFIEKDTDIKALCKASLKLETIYQGIVRKGLVTDDGKLTVLGSKLLEFVRSPKIDENLMKRKEIADHFTKWWAAYPGTDTFTHKGKDFTGTRSLRTKKDDCKEKLNKILLEGEYKISELIAALEFEVMQKKEASITSKTNKLSFMQNSLTYLNQRSFEPFIELIRQGKTIKQVPKIVGTTNI